MENMIKLEALKIKQINAIMRERKLPITGNKAHKIAKLIEVLGSDEIGKDDIPMADGIVVEPWQDQINSLRAVVEGLAQSMSLIAQGQQRINEHLGSAQHAQTAASTNNQQQQQHIYGQRIQEQVIPDSVIISSPTQGLGSGNPRDIMGVLPEFDPLKRILTAHQFVNKVEQLQQIYMWSNEIILFAAQQKLRGVAKDWLDSQPAMRSWQDFTSALKKDFPSTINTADVHRELMKRRRKPNETLMEYYYFMLAVGRKGELDDVSLNSYIINGLNDCNLTRTLLAMNLQSSHELLRSMESLSTQQNGQQNVPQAKLSVAGSTEVHVHKEDGTLRQSSERRGTKCYNCNGFGHIAIKCPQPQRQVRCAMCSKVGHTSQNCPTKKSTVAKIEESAEHGEAAPPFIVEITLNEHKLDAFVDTGSDVSLIRESAVPNSMQRQKRQKCLKGFGGAIVQSQEIIEGALQMREHTIVASLQIVPDACLPQPILLGRDVICKADQRLIIESGVLQVQSKRANLYKVGQELGKTDNDALQNLLENFNDCFAEDLSGLGRCRNTEMEISETTEKPIIGKRYQVPFSQRDHLKAIIDNLLHYDIIRRSNSPHAASVVLVSKSNGEKRMCVDYRSLNAVTVKKNFPMPIVEEQLSKLAGNKVFTTLDMTSGYYQIPVKETDKKYTAFLTHDGLYEHNVMPFGLVNASMYFQEVIVRIISQLENYRYIISYVDEVIIATDNVQKSLMVLNEFLVAIRREGLTLRPSKCSFMAEQVSFLGHIVTSEGIQPGKEKTRCIEHFPVPTNVHGVRQFLGVTGFFRKFVGQFSELARPLTKLLRKDAIFEWGDEQEKAFMKLKQVIISQPILTIFDSQKKHEVHTDASSHGLSGILFQKESNGEVKPVFYYSRQCSTTEEHYSSHELEVLAIVDALERFRVYLLGTQFEVVTDCNAIATTKASTPLLPRIARWWLKLQEYDFTCIHRAGVKMSHVDGMSRMPTLPPAEITTVADNIFKIADYNDDWILALQRQDQNLGSIIKTLHGQGETDPATVKQIKIDYAIRKGRLYRKVDGDYKLVVPPKVRWRIAKSCHDDCGHFGVEKTIERMRQHFWFHRLRRYVKSYIAACPECCLNKVKGGKLEGRLHLREVLPIPFRSVHADHLGPFPRSKRGNCYVIVLVCAFSKFSILRALRNTKTAPVVTVLEEVISIFGQPLMITTDRGTAFTSKEFTNFLAMHGIRQIKAAVRTPRANGQAERINKTVLSALKCSSKRDNEWDTELSKLQWSINSQRNATTKFTPNELIFRYNPRDMTENRVIQALHDDSEDSFEPSDKQQDAAQNITDAQRKWKSRYDSKHREPRQYAEGDLIVIDHIPQATGTSNKLEPAYKGPYVVSKELSFDRYLVEDLPDQHRTKKPYSGVFSTDHMKPWCSMDPNLDGDDDDFQAAESSSEDEMSGRAELSNEHGNPDENQPSNERAHDLRNRVSR